MRVIDRLEKYLNEKGITPYRFERDAIVANGYLAKQINGAGGAIGSNILGRIYKMYPDLNLVWLITGNGEMIVDGTDNLFPKLKPPSSMMTSSVMIRMLNEQNELLRSLLIDKERIIKSYEKKERRKR